jgi:phosphoribosylglycinamide formyltransferase-1
MNIGVLASHEGTTLQSVLDACAEGRITGRVTLVVSNNSGSGALRRARQAGVKVAHLSSTTHPDPGALDLAIRNALGAAAVDLVLLAGYMKKLGPVTIEAFTGRILNTHPALLPKFGGQGMYGNRVFEAVIEAGETESGVSIHLVNSAFDAGRVVRQCKVPVFPGDSSETLKTRTRMREREFVAETLADIARGALALGEAGG